MVRSAWATVIRAASAVPDQLARSASTSACVCRIGSADEIVACEAPALSYDSVLGAVVPDNRAVCQHVMDIMKVEMGDAAATPSDEDIEKYTEKCVQDLDKEKQKLGAAKFSKQAKCVMAAQKMEDMMACEPKD
jgi:hypothetical protein